MSASTDARRFEVFMNSFGDPEQLGSKNMHAAIEYKHNYFTLRIWGFNS